MKKSLIILAMIMLTLIFFNCGEPMESVWHYVTLEQGEEMDFQLDAVTKWDTVYFGRGINKTNEPENAEWYEIYTKDSDPPYYHFFYVAAHDFVGKEEDVVITLSRSPNDQNWDEIQQHFFYITVVER